MEFLPPELLARITSLLSAKQKQLTPYVTISRAWQRAVEQHIFSHLSFSSDELAKLDSAVINSVYTHRRIAISRVDFSVRLPDYNDEACGRFERKADRRINDEVFGKAISDLFKLLAAIGSGHNSRLIDLHLLHFYSSMDINCRGEERFRGDKMAKASGKRHDLFELRYRDSYLQLLQPESLPLLHNITSLTIAGNTSRKLAPTVAPGLISRLPNLISMNCSFSDMDRKRPDRRTRLRSDFSKQLTSIDTSKTLQKVVFSFRHAEPANEHFVSTDSRGRICSLANDDLSTTLRRFSRAVPGLTNLKLSGPICIGPEVFRGPKGGELPQGIQQHWQALKVFTVELSAVRPDGGWYTELDPDRENDDSDEEEEDGENASEDTSDIIYYETSSQKSSSGYDSSNSFFATDELPPDSYGYEDEKRDQRLNGQKPSAYFRTRPTLELEDFFTAAAYAAACMPSLRNMSVSLEIRPSGRTGRKRRKIGFVYLAAGVKGLRDVAKERSRRRLTWDAPKGWRMGERLQEQWASFLGQDGVVKYKEW